MRSDFQGRTEAVGPLSERLASLPPAKRVLLELRLKQKRQAPRGEPAIPRLADRHSIPASFAQQRLWFLHQLEPKSSAYSMSTILRFKGRLDVAALERSLNEISRRHEVLRTTFKFVDHQLTQIVHPNTALRLPISDLSHISPSKREIEARRIAAEEVEKPFDLAEGKLFRTALLRLDDEDHIFLCVMHHIVSDGWSMGILYRELGRLYETFRNGKPSPLRELPIQYADFAVWQRRWLQGEVLEKQLLYWRQQLGGMPRMLELPTDRRRPVVQTFRGASKSHMLSSSLAQKLRALSRQNRVTLFMTLLAAFKILLGRHTGQEDIVIGSPIAGRNRIEIEELIGFFINTLVLRTDLSGNPTFRELLIRTRKVCLDAYAHQDLPFEKLVEELRPERDLSRTPLFQAFFNMLALEGRDLKLEGLEVEPLTRVVPESKFDLTLYVRERDDEVQLKLVYNVDLFDQDRMAEMLVQFDSLLSQIASNPDRGILSFSLVTPRAKKVLPSPVQPLGPDWLGAVHHRFSEQARRVPERIAVESGEAAWTYGQLESRSNRLANYLLAIGIRSGDVVALYGCHAPSLVCAILGTLKAGAAFMILDSAYPAQRLMDYLRITQPKGWIALQKAGSLPEELERLLADLPLRFRLELPDSPFEWEESCPLMEMSDSDPGCASDPDDLAYIAFTSGTVGQPKAIQGSHRPLSHFFDWHCKTFGLSENDRFSMISGLSHDPLLRDIFTPLWLGATLCIPDMKRLSAGDLAEWMRKQKISVAHLTSAMGELLTEAPEPLAGTNSSLRFVFFGGDILTGQHVAKIRLLAPSATCVNFYGATETPQAMAYFIVPSDREKSPRETQMVLKEIIPLGRGISDVQLLILNASRGLAGIGEVGEIYIRTPYLAKGYLREEAMDQECFLLNPFTRQSGDGVYRTGDLGRYAPDGSVEFAGRRDQQVKIRGFRVEPAEIEALLEQHSDIGRAVVHPTEDHPGGKRLLAYAVSKRQPAPSSTDLRSFLRRRLPEYMVPAGFVFLKSLPLTPNGKVDRGALPDFSQIEVDSEAISVAPRDEIESQLAEIWQQILGVKSVGIRDSFFDRGGHSLLAVRLFAQIERLFGKKLPLATLFQAPTIEQMADYLRREDCSSSWSSLVAIQPDGSKPPFFSVHAHEGNVLFYRDLALRLGPEQPFYALQAQGLVGKEPPHHRIEEMAAHYIKEIRAIQPQGPYFIGGYCFGGRIAFEMARQLQAEGQKVGLLALFDAYSPGYLTIVQNSRSFLGKAHWHIQRVTHHIANFLLLGSGERASYIKERFKKLLYKLSTRDDSAMNEAHQKTLKNMHEAALSYNPQPYSGRVILFRAATLYSAYRHKPDFGWGRLVTGELEVHEIPGHYGNIIFEPRVRVLAEKLRACLQNASAAQFQEHLDRRER